MDTTESPPTTAPAAGRTMSTRAVARQLDVTIGVVHDWLTYGVVITSEKGRKRIALRGRKIGGRWKITQADLDEFVKVTTEASISPDAIPAAGAVETDAQFRKRAAEAKARVAKRLGG